jgi:hypothetical protein
MKDDFLGFSPDKQSKIILTFGLMLTFVIFYGLTNHFKGVVLPNKYEVLIGKELLYENLHKLSLLTLHLSK